MTTNNPDTRSLEELAGVPYAAELEQLANANFPDLTDNAYAATPAAPEAQNASAAQGVSAAQGAAAINQTPVFDWEHPFAERPETQAPFAYGGSSTDTWLNTVEAPAAPEAQFLPQQGDVAVTPAPATGYSPKVVSKTQAYEANRKVDAPTSLGGDSAKNASAATSGNSRNDSIRIGSKTLSQIRADFPILSKQINGHPLVWLDNGATTQRPQQVIDRIKYYYENENSNVHRGAHTLAAASTDAYENARGIVRDFIGAPSAEEIVFVRGTTEAINLVANAYVKPTLQPGDEIIVSILEHHANIVPWQLIAEETGAIIKVIPCDSTGQLKLHDYEALFTKRTKFVSVTHVSNVLGTVTPIEELIAIAHRHGVRILIDGAQSIAHIPVNVATLDADFFVFSGHKVFAPTGIGVVYGKKELLEAARPYHGGGNMIADVTFERTIYNGIPNKFEAGTGSIADAVGLGEALKYLSEIGMPCVFRWEHELLQYGLKELKTVKGLHLVGTALNKASALAFKLDGYSDEEVGKRLDAYGVAVRTGHHCAQPVLRHFGYESTVRPTLALYNSPDDIDALVRALKTFA
ncbi:SufS family cysteine desulfurase [Fibrobacter sp.]|uniref:SufS family cysteine desulfurase n=1 Tax=Fibrobacter sp. TaxID=35828 RepID=UPI00386E4E72